MTVAQIRLQQSHDKKTVQTNNISPFASIMKIFIVYYNNVIIVLLKSPKNASTFPNLKQRQNISGTKNIKFNLIPPQTLYVFQVYTIMFLRNKEI